MFGHEYLATYHEQYVRECAKVAGIDFDGLTKNSFIVNPADEDGAGGMQPRLRFGALSEPSSLATKFDI